MSDPCEQHFCPGCNEVVPIRVGETCKRCGWHLVKSMWKPPEATEPPTYAHQMNVLKHDVERLREALGLIREHAMLDHQERSIAEAERYYVIADDVLEASVAEMTAFRESQA